MVVPTTRITLRRSPQRSSPAGQGMPLRTWARTRCTGTSRHPRTHPVPGVQPVPARPPPAAGADRDRL